MNGGCEREEKRTVKKMKRVLDGTKDVISEIWEERSNGRCCLDPTLSRSNQSTSATERETRPFLARKSIIQPSLHGHALVLLLLRQTNLISRTKR